MFKRFAGTLGTLIAGIGIGMTATVMLAAPQQAQPSAPAPAAGRGSSAPAGPCGPQGNWPPSSRRTSIRSRVASRSGCAPSTRHGSAPERSTAASTSCTSGSAKRKSPSSRSMVRRSSACGSTSATPTRWCGCLPTAIAHTARTCGRSSPPIRVEGAVEQVQRADHAERVHDERVRLLPDEIRRRAPWHSVAAHHCVVSVAEHTGWAHLVCVAAPGGVPAVVERRRVTLIDAGLPTQPYEHDSRAMREDEADALIHRVRRSIDNRSSLALRRLVTELAPAHAVVALAIREPPFPDLPDSVATVRQSHRLTCCADGMLYQLAMCRAARERNWRCGCAAAGRKRRGPLSSLA